MRRAITYINSSFGNFCMDKDPYGLRHKLKSSLKRLTKASDDVLFEKGSFLDLYLKEYISYIERNEFNDNESDPMVNPKGFRGSRIKDAPPDDLKLFIELFDLSHGRGETKRFISKSFSEVMFDVEYDKVKIFLFKSNSDQEFYCVDNIEDLKKNTGHLFLNDEDLSNSFDEIKSNKDIGCITRHVNGMSNDLIICDEHILTNMISRYISGKSVYKDKYIRDSVDRIFDVFFKNTSLDVPIRISILGTDILPYHDFRNDIRKDISWNKANRYARGTDNWKNEARKDLSIIAQDCLCDICNCFSQKFKNFKNVWLTFIYADRDKNLHDNDTYRNVFSNTHILDFDRNPFDFTLEAEEKPHVHKDPSRLIKYVSKVHDYFDKAKLKYENIEVFDQVSGSGNTTVCHVKEYRKQNNVRII